LRQVKKIARVKSTDPDAIGSYPLSSDQAREIAKLLDKRIELEPRASFFLEPVAPE